VVVALRVVQFTALILTALALAPAVAELFSLPNKIGLGVEQYIMVQGIYRAGSLFGFVLVPAILVNLLLTVMLRGRGAPFVFAVLAVLCMAATLVNFFIWIYPANMATDNWTAIPANWQELRSQWEYTHAADAVITFIALCAVAVSVLIEMK
jgi:hypothetical protein